MKSSLTNDVTVYFKYQIIEMDQLDDRHTQITVLRDHLPEICSYIQETGGRLVTMTGADERELHGDFQLYYVFAFDRDHSFLTLRSRIPAEDPNFPSVTRVLSAADWYEREVHDLLGLTPAHHPHPAPLVLHGDWPEGLYPLRRDYPINQKPPRAENREVFMNYEGEGVTKILVGPIHAGIIEPGHFRFGAVGDSILHLDAKLFYTHRGIEKKSEGMPLNKALFLAERICGVCALSHALAYAQAVEGIAGVEIPIRAQYLRTLFLEMERLYNHVGDVGNIGGGMGFSFGVSQGSRIKERLMQLNEQITGHRYLRGIAALGGVRRDPADADIRYLEQTLADIEQDFREMAEILMSHEISLDRMSGTGRLTKDQVDQLGCVGPAARASGRSVDIRKSHPYLVYDQLQFAVPVCTEGDVKARIQVRIDEVLQSFSIIRQILSALPGGPIQTGAFTVPAYRWGLGWTESPRGENVHWLMTGPDQTVYRYRVRSAAYSNWPSVALSARGNIVPDFPLINKSFELCYACCDR